MAKEKSKVKVPNPKGIIEPPYPWPPAPEPRKKKPNEEEVKF